MLVDGLAYPWSTCPFPICEEKEMYGLGLRVGRRMGVNRISFWGRGCEKGDGVVGLLWCIVLCLAANYREPLFIFVSSDVRMG